MSKLNNVDVEALTKTSASIQQDPSKGKKTNRVEGVWNFGAGQPQFSSEVAFEGGKVVLQADQPSAQGGGGNSPSPIQYCLFGLASCFTATFVTVAATEGVELTEVRTVAESDMNMARSFGLSDAPAIDEARISLTVRTSASPETVQRLAPLAEERCPAVFCLTNPVRLVPSVTVER